MIEAALEYLNQGYCVIPVKRDKKPYLMTWAEYQEKMPTASQVEKWWKTWPDANIGIVTGKVSNICVVDVDSNAGGNAIKELIPNVKPNVITPNGGWHFYFANNNGTGNAVGFIPDVDFRGQGGYIIAPPSIGDNGKAYSIYKDNDINRSNLLPESIISLLSLTRYHNCKDCADGGALQAGNKNVTNVTFDKGSRDNALFHLANHLVKGGMPHQNIRKYLQFFAQNCEPPFSQKETEVKILSALDREKNQEKTFYELVKDWVCNIDVTIKLQDGYNALHCVTRDDKAKLRVYFKRLTDEKVLIKTGTGQYRMRKDNLEWLDLENADTVPFNIKWPLGVESLVKVPKGGLVLVAGQQGAGKTAYLLNVAKMNMNRGKEVVFLSTETRAQGLKIRLEAFGEEDVSIKELTQGIKFAFLEGDVIEAIENHSLEESILIVDYLEVDDKFWMVAPKLAEIFRKMKNGLPIVGLQMHQDRLLGGNFGLHKPEIVLTLKKDKETRYSYMTIEKARWWADPAENPEFKSAVFSLRQGCIIRQLDEWERKKK